MERTIEVDDATTIRLTVIGFGKWQVAVGQTLMQTEVEKHSINSQDIRFQLPDGRNVTIAIRPQPGIVVTLDARVGAQDIIDPGPWPFECPRCRDKVRPRDQSCTNCSAAQPSAETRVRERCRRSAARGLWRRTLMWTAMLVAFVFAQRRSVGIAFANLSRAQPMDDAAALTLDERLIGEIMIATAAVVLTAVCALLARRFPATAIWMSWLIACVAFLIYWDGRGRLSVFLFAGVVLLLGLIAISARTARAAQRVPFDN
jgi:hypothetical protein